MEDSSLDDFFAKKDKTKKKSKAAKFTTSDILAKQIDKPKKSKKKGDKNASNQSGGGSSSSKRKQEDDEWKDFAEEEEKDFSDLKIGNLQISSQKDDEDGDRGGSGSGSDDEDGEGGREKRDGSSGPWNKSAPNPAAQETQAPEVIPEPQPAPKEEPPKTSGKYIPPGLRRAMEAGGGAAPSPYSGGGGPGHRQRKKEAPNVMSEVDFPSLGGMSSGDSYQSQDVERKSNVAQFEQVRGGSRQTDDPRAQSGKVEIGNMYDALSSADN